VKFVYLVALGKSIEGCSLDGLRQLEEQFLVFPIQVKDLEELGVRLVDEFLRVVERRKQFGLQALEVAERLVELGEDGFLAFHQALLGGGLLCLEPSVFLKQEGVNLFTKG
jgi:hypothetical protein